METQTTDEGLVKNILDWHRLSTFPAQSFCSIETCMKEGKMNDGQGLATSQWSVYK